MNLSDFQGRLSLISPSDFERFVVDILRRSAKFEEIRVNVVIRGFQIDVSAIEKSIASQKTTWLFEIKRVKVVGVDIVRNLSFLQESLRHDLKLMRIVLVTSGGVTREALAYSQHAGVEIWDAVRLADLADDDLIQDYLGMPKEEGEPPNRKAEALVQALASISSGTSGWSRFQKLSSDILEYLFCPPLETPRYEVIDSEAFNRRDMIFENAAHDGFWANIRQTYRAHYVVADAKNYATPLNKRPVLEMAHYLKPYGCGMFGLLVSRKGAGRQALHAIREQWIGAEKLIVSLADSEVVEMIELKRTGGRPEEIVRRLIADFRMSL